MYMLKGNTYTTLNTEYIQINGIVYRICVYELFENENMNAMLLFSGSVFVSNMLLFKMSKIVIEFKVFVVVELLLWI